MKGINFCLLNFTNVNKLMKNKLFFLSSTTPFVWLISFHLPPEPALREKGKAADLGVSLPTGPAVPLPTPPHPKEAGGKTLR